MGVSIIGEVVALFIHRVAFQYIAVRVAFYHVWLEITVCLVAVGVVIMSVFEGVALEGFVLVKFITIFVGRAILISPRAYRQVSGSLSQQTEKAFGWMLCLLLFVNILEAAYTACKTGYYGGLLLGIGLVIPVVSLPVPSTFFINDDGFFLGTTWLWIAAYTVWNLAFTIVLHPVEADLSYDGVLANAAGLSCDMLIAFSVHPGKWVHSRGLSLMWNLTFNYMFVNQPLMTDLNDTMDLTDAAYAGIDVTASSLGIIFVLANILIVQFGSKHQRIMLLEAPWCAKYGQKNPYKDSEGSEACAAGGVKGAEDATISSSLA